MQPGQIITIGPIPAHMRALESRIVDALPEPREGEIRNALAFAIVGSLAVVAISILSVIH